MDEIQSCSVIRKSESTVNLFFWKEWLEKGIRTIIDLLDKIEMSFHAFPVFQSKYSVQKTTFLHYYQAISAIPGHLLTKVKTKRLQC